MVTLTFTGTPSEIYAEMTEILVSAGRSVVHSIPTIGTEAILRANKLVADVSDSPSEQMLEAANTFTPAPAAEKTRKPRRTKAQIEADKLAAEAADEVTPPEEADESPAALQDEPIAPSKVSKQTVHEALQQVNVAVGLPKAREILTHFKVNRMSELQPDQYGAFIEKCNAAVMQS